MTDMRTVRIAVLVVIAALGLLIVQGLGDTETAGVISIALADSPAEHPDVEFDVSCNDCHVEATPEAYAAWESSLHGEVNIKCFICHGDGTETFTMKPPVETCRGCHDKAFAAFEASGQESCFSCHNAHTLKFHQC